jgi:hypothetical protein
MRFGDLPRTAQLYVAGIGALALVQTALAALAASQTSASAPTQLFVLLIGAATIAHSFPVSTPGKQAYHVSLPFFVAAIIVLAPLQLIAVIGVVRIAEMLRRRRSTVRCLPNDSASQTSCAAQLRWAPRWA